MPSSWISPSSAWNSLVVPPLPAVSGRAGANDGNAHPPAAPATSRAPPSPSEGRPTEVQIAPKVAPETSSETGGWHAETSSEQKAKVNGQRRRREFGPVSSDGVGPHRTRSSGRTDPVRTRRLRSWLSCWYSRPGPVAQLVEQRTFNPLVQGSRPCGPTSNEAKSFVFLVMALPGQLQ